ncbi:MAG: hypothetical protein NWE93_01980 [Candidatus Bathyarchaeota archaeon]|nr:hypothetical protein [Candidatus Bathyarchaeota archaeon]
MSENTSDDLVGSEGKVGEPKHTTGHSTAVAKMGEGEFMCPECGKTFTVQDAAEKHLHLVHMKHLRSEHNEFHDRDVDTMHVEA